MRKHRFIGFVLAATTVAGLSLSATTPASASVVISGGGGGIWHPPVVNVPFSQRQALLRPPSAASGSPHAATLFSEIGTQLPIGLEYTRRHQSLQHAARLESMQLGQVLRGAFDAAFARLAAASAPTHTSGQRVSVAASVSSPALTPVASAPAHASDQRVSVAESVSSPAPAPVATSGDVWAELRQCESGGNYAENTGNGFYGAYQFAPGTWTGLGYSGLPSDAPPAVQDAAAQQLQARSGWGQWPACSAQLGLR